MDDLKIGRMVLGPVSTNCYFLFREKTMQAVVFDPADYGADIFRALKEKGLEVVAIVLTHGHFDHIGGVAKLRQLSHCRIYAGEHEVDMLSDPSMNQSANHGMEITVTPDELLHDGQEIELGGITFKVLETPGHTGGGLCFYVPDAGMLISGDTLFECSVGRTDFPGGSMAKLIDSIRDKLLTLPDDTKVFPGHGGSTTIGFEKENNPFL